MKALEILRSIARPLACLGVIVAFGLGWMASAEAQGPDLSDPRYRVFLAAPLTFYPDPDKARKGTPQFNTEVLSQAIETYFADDTARFNIIPAGDFFKSFTRPSQGTLSDKFPGMAEIWRADKTASFLVEDGEEALARADLDKAEALLLQAVRLYEEVQAGLLIPRGLARIYEYLALVYDEQRGRNQGDEGLEEKLYEVMRKLVRIDPERVMVYPFYSDSIESVYRRARASVLASRESGADTVDRAAAQRFAEFVTADIVLWGYVVQEGDRLTLTLHMYRADNPEVDFYPPERIELSQDRGIQVERATRLASRYAACIEPLPVPRPLPLDVEKGRFYLDTTFAFFVFLRPSTTAFNNFGFSVAGNYMVSENFALLGRVNFLTSGSDFQGDLRNEFSSIRSYLGGAFSLKLSIFRPYISFAMEASRIGEFQLTDNFFCKVNPKSPGCAPGDITVQNPGWLLGINSQAGGSMKLYRDLYMTASGSFSFFVFPLSKPPLDFPLGFDIGLEYRF